MPSQVVQIDGIGKVTFSQNPRSKNIKLSVKANRSVLVSYPLYVSSKEVITFMLKNKNWISVQQEKMGKRQKRIEANTVLKTKLHTISFLPADDYRLSKKGSEIRVYAPNFDSDETTTFFEKAVTEIYRIEAKRLLPHRITELAKRHGFEFNKLTIRNNKRNWGSCSSKNNISLNLQMMKLPVELIDYILLHELVHTKVKNHGPQFWQLLNEVSNGKARQLAKQVKEYSTYSL